MYRILLFLLALSCSVALPAQNQREKVVTGIVLLNDQAFPDPDGFKTTLAKDWSIRPDSIVSVEKRMLLYLPDATVMMAYLDYPVAANEIYTASAISWLWKDAAAATAAHQAQWVITVMGPAQRSLQLYQLFTKVAATALTRANASGVYMNDQLLVLSKGYYLEAARTMSEQNLPVNCWVYFGLMEENGKTGAFTFGLEEFGFTELEIAGSQHSLAEVLEVISAATRYVIAYNVQLKEGQSIPLDSGLKIPVHLSEAVFLESGKSFKLAF